MKLTKKLFVAALAVVGFTFAGCNMNQDTYNIIDFDAPNNCAKVDFTNETGEMQRAWKTFNSKHKTGNCVINIGGSNGAGNMGFIWGIEDGADDTCSFYIAAINKNGSNSYRYYVSYFEGVGKQYLSGTTSNFCDKDGNQISTTPTENGAKEIYISSGAGGWTSYNSSKIGFKLSWVKDTGYELEVFSDIDSTGTGVGSPTTMTFAKAGEDTAATEAPDKGMGVYAMVYNGLTLQGEWDFPGFTAFSNINEVVE